MNVANQISPGMTIHLDGNIYRVESLAKVTVAKGHPFIKVQLRNLIDDTVIERNFKLDQAVQEVAFAERTLEFLYPEGESYLFLDIGSLDQILVSLQILGDKVHYLKEGIQVKSMFYGDTIFAVELPQFLELMVVKTESDEESNGTTNNTKRAHLETGAIIRVPLFIESGDVVKVDTVDDGYVQRV